MPGRRGILVVLAALCVSLVAALVHERARSAELGSRLVSAQEAVRSAAGKTFTSPAFEHLSLIHI